MNLKMPKQKFNGIVLREIEFDDYLDFYKIGSKEEVCKYLTWGPYKNPSEALFVIKEIFYKRPDDGIPVGYAIIYNKAFVGMIDYHTKNEAQNSIEIGYFLDPDYWGLGIMRKCLKKAIEVAFDHYGYDKVCIGSFPDNERSINLIEKSGFKYEYEKMIDMGEEEYKIASYYSLYKSDFGGIE